MREIDRGWEGIIPPMTFPPMGFIPQGAMPQMGAIPSGHPFMGSYSGFRDSNIVPGGLKSIVSVWIGKIAPSVTEKHMHALLDVIGGPYNWKRVPDPRTGKRKLFGFAEWSTPKSAILAQKLLNNLQVGESQLLVKVDEKTQQMLNEANEDPINAITEKEEKRIFEQLLLVSNNISKELKLDENGTVGSPGVATNVNRVEDLKKDAREKERCKDAEKKTEKKRLLKEREQYRLEQEEKEYARIERELTMEQKKLSESIAAFKLITEGIASRLEKIEKENNADSNTPFFSTSEEWRMRRYEREMDEKEKEEEERRRLRELKMEKRKLSETAHAVHHHQQQQHHSPSVKQQVPATSSDSTAATCFIQDNTTSNQNIYDSQDTTIVGEDQKHISSPLDNAMQDDDIESLFKCPLDVKAIIKHGNVGSEVFDWIKEMVTEYLDQEEVDLTNFIYSCLGSKSPDEIVVLLQPILEDEAKVFVAKLWRMLALKQSKLKEFSAGQHLE